MIWEILSLLRLQKKLKLGNFPSEKMCSGVKGKAGLLFAASPKYQNLRVLHHTKGCLKRLGMWLIDSSSFLSRNQDKRWEYRKDLWRRLLSNRVHSCDICLGFTSFWKCYTSGITDSLDWKSREDKMKKGCWPPKILLIGNRPIRLLIYSSWERQHDSKGWTVSPEGAAASQRELTSVLGTWVCLLRFQNCLRLVTSFYFIF